MIIPYVKAYYKRFLATERPFSHKQSGDLQGRPRAVHSDCARLSVYPSVPAAALLCGVKPGMALRWLPNRSGERLVPASCPAARLANRDYRLSQAFSLADQPASSGYRISPAACPAAQPDRCSSAKASRAARSLGMRPSTAAFQSRSSMRPTLWGGNLRARHSGNRSFP